MKKVADLIRSFILWSTQWTAWAKQLPDRAVFTEIGSTGNVSLPDKSIAKERGLKQLNRFEKWLLQPAIQYEKSRRKDAFRQACIEVLGEDPERDWV